MHRTSGCSVIREATHVGICVHVTLNSGYYCNTSTSQIHNLSVDNDIQHERDVHAGSWTVSMRVYHGASVSRNATSEAKWVKVPTCRPGGLAPTSSLIFSPFLNAMKVGIYDRATPVRSSVSKQPHIMYSQRARRPPAQCPPPRQRRPCSSPRWGTARRASRRWARSACTGRTTSPRSRKWRGGRR